MADFFNPQFLLTVALTAALIFVNGWTDAPNAVATCIGSGAMRPRAAINMAAVFNLLGIVVMYLCNDSVSKTIESGINLGTHHRLTALCASIIAVVLFAAVAAFFGIPTSEGHALFAALAGTAAAQGEQTARVGFWGYVVIGAFITAVAGFVLGAFFDRVLLKMRIKNKALRKVQIISAALLAFMHGAQDGQKFTAIMLLSLSLSGTDSEVRLPLIFLSGALMAVGTAVGGKKIIKRVGSGITPLDERSGVGCDMSAFLCLALCTCFGLPVSTTHTKTAAVVGVGCSRGVLNVRAFSGIALAWVVTLPACFLISFFITKICI